MNERELLHAANANFLASFRKLAEHSATGAVREVGGVFAFASGHPVPLFNGCLVPDAASPAELGEALHWVREHHVPYRVWIAESLVTELGGILLQAGLELHHVPYPSMVLHPVPEPPPPAANVTVAEVGRDQLVDTAGGLGFSHELAEAVFSPSFASDPDVRLFTGGLDGRPAGYSIAIRSGGMSGVYAVGVARGARRRGVGTALTWAAVDAGRGWDCEAVTLQSSEMALGMYGAMGFRTVLRYADFREPVSPTGHETPVPPSPQ